MNLFEVVHRILEWILYIKDAHIYKNGWPSNSKLINDNLLSIELGKDIISSISSLESLYPNIYSNTELSFNNFVLFKKLSLPTNFDLRLYWESQRFNQLLNLAFKGNASQKIESHLINWMSNNPPLKGVNYISTMECAIRCINLYATLSVLKRQNNLTDDLLKVSYVFFSVNYRLIKNRLSLFSSRGNHTLFEYAGLVVCSNFIMPEKNNHWSLKCLDEFDFQTLKDGAGVEQSTAYHLFNVEVTWLIQTYLSKNEFLSKKLDIAIEYCSDFWVNNNIVRFGDSDSSVLFSRLFIIEKLSRIKTPSITNYSHSGILILRNEFFTCYFKYGRLGLPPLFGHGHYDFLSLVVLDNHGNYLTPDSQTYLYNTLLRNEFRSSKYHSMPSCGKDDIASLSSFSWEKQNSGKLAKSQNGWVHGLYERNDDITIKRSIKFVDNYLIVLDGLYDCKGDNVLNIDWLTIPAINYYLFFEIDSKGNSKPLLPIASELNHSKTYGKLESDLILSYSLQVEKNMKILTLLSTVEFDLPLNEKNIKNLVWNIL